MNTNYGNNSTLSIQFKITELDLPKVDDTILAKEERSGIQEDFSNIPICGFVKHEELHKLFINLGHINGGGEASIFKVQSCKTEKIYALRVEHAMCQLNLAHRTDFFKYLIKYQNQNPHLVKTYAAFWLENKNYPFFGAKKTGVAPWTRLNKEDFVCRHYANDPEARIYYHEIMIMEIGNDTESREFYNINVNPLITRIQTLFNRYSLSKANIGYSDEKMRNYIWKPLQDEKWNDHQLSEYPYWHYKIQDYDIYIPRPDFILKRVDLSGWRLPCSSASDEESSLEEKSEVDWLGPFLEWNEMSKDKFLTHFSKPDVPDSEILNMNF